MSWKVTREPDGYLWFGPLPILGGWLPLVGFIDVDVDVDGDPCFGGQPRAGVASFFVVEWLGRGCTLFRCTPRMDARP